MIKPRAIAKQATEDGAVNWSRYADMIIEHVETIMQTGEKINMSDMAKQDGITGYIGRQYDGDEISGEVAAEVDLSDAMNYIHKNTTVEEWKQGAHEQCDRLDDLYMSVFCKDE